MLRCAYCLKRPRLSGFVRPTSPAGPWILIRAEREARPERGVQRSLISYSVKAGPQVRPQAVFRTWQELEALEQTEPDGDFRGQLAITTTISTNNAKEKHAHG